MRIREVRREAKRATVRGQALRDEGRHGEAAIAFGEASRLWGEASTRYNTIAIRALIVSACGYAVSITAIIIDSAT